MLDFLVISTRCPKRGVVEVYPNFKVGRSHDLMIRGGDFYAIWVEDRGLWSTDEEDVIRLIDMELDKYVENNKHHFEIPPVIKYMWNSESGAIDQWHKYCQKQQRDNFIMLDEQLAFLNSDVQKEDYVSKKLSYPLESCPIPAYNKLMDTIYDPEERNKIDWAIGAIVCGDSKKLQKFMVLYGSAGTGKSTVLNIIQKLFDGYYSVFDAKALGSSSNSFALEAFKTNPLVAIQHDGDLSRIEDNTRLNSLVSHELMTVNEKFKATYANSFKSFIFMGTNKPVKITDGKSGLIRRLIDVTPSGRKIPINEYHDIMSQIEFELGGIAAYCRDLYLSNPHAYNDYIPLSMMGATNDFYNFVYDSYPIFKKDNGISLNAAWEMYKNYCEDAKVPFPHPKRIFKEELKNYFEEHVERYTFEDGTRIRNYYHIFKTDKFTDIDDDSTKDIVEKKIEPVDYIDLSDDFGLKIQESILDKECANDLAQYANKKETPNKAWDKVNTKLKDLDTGTLHYLKPSDEHHIVIDFDKKDKDGNKSLALNIKAARKWPATYAEVSKGENGLHLHYIYDGDVSKLSSLYEEHVEIKIFTGKSSLRRKLSKCNDIPIAHINSGLPLRGDKVLNFDGIKNEKILRSLIRKNLNKEIHSATKPSVDFIFKNLEDAYNSGIIYDVSDLKPAILSFAASSSNNSEYCVKLVSKMQFKSEEENEAIENPNEKPYVFYDVEVFPNLLLICWKYAGDNTITSWFNPTPSMIEKLCHEKLIGFNCRRYDNHILYAAMLGYTPAEIYKVSKMIISGNKSGFFREAWNISYTDIYDFSTKKQSLKKFEIDLGIHHQELGMDWDKPVPKELWDLVKKYCEYDVQATEATFNDRAADFRARNILADVAGRTVNDTTNTITTTMIFGNNKNPQNEFNYRFLGDDQQVLIHEEGFDEYTAFDLEGRPIFPGYKFDMGKSTYRDEEVGEGGYVYGKPGIYTDVALLDIASMHPSSLIAENLFGDVYTKRFKEIKDTRIAIKHSDWETARSIRDGAFAKYLNNEEGAEELSDALKIPINSVYGLTSAKFENPMRDPRNIDNIVAKRGALFMINLKHEVQKRGFTVAHIKTDSIKIPNATKEIIDFVSEYGKMYGYDFEHEATYDRICLVNNSVYIAKHKDCGWCMDHYGYIPKKNIKAEKKGKPWTATGTQFQVPYVFKTLFSKEDLEFADFCEAKSVQTSLYLDVNEKLPSVTEFEGIKDLRKKVEKINAGLLKSKITKNEQKIYDEYSYLSDEELNEKISVGHDYVFVGKVGNFCPVKNGKGGGVLVRDNGDGYSSATGADGFKWMEAELVGQNKDFLSIIDERYYINKVNEALEAIREYGDTEWFIYGDSKSEAKEVPWVSPCGSSNVSCNTCMMYSDGACEYGFISQK